MRRLETLLLLVTLAVSYFTYIERTSPVGAIIVLSVFIAHVLTEGARWQLTLAYLVATISIMVAALHSGLEGTPNHLVFWLGALGLLASLALGLGLPIEPTPLLSGPYPVGTSTFHLAQLDRREIHAQDPEVRRQLMMQVWYPAMETLNPRADYIPDRTRGSRALTSSFGMPWFGLDHLNLIRRNARIDPEVAASDERFPVLLFSHGRSGTRIQNTYQVEELVSHGYVVAAVDHPYGSGYTMYPDGQIISYDKSIFGDDSPAQAGPVINEWVLDLQCVLDTLEDFNAPDGGQFANALDLRRVGVFGHSAGGGTAFELCSRDDRCGPVLAYDPWVVPMSERAASAGLEHPIMVLKQEASLGRFNEARLHTLFEATTPETYWYEVAGTKHLDFNDYKQLLPVLDWIGMTGSIDREQLQEIMNEFTRSFFDEHLRGFPPSPTLGGSHMFPEVHRRR